MKNHIDVVAIAADHNFQLRDKINDELKDGDKLVSVMLTEARWNLKTYLVVIHRNVSPVFIRKIDKKVMANEPVQSQP